MTFRSALLSLTQVPCKSSGNDRETIYENMCGSQIEEALAGIGSNDPMY
jgi:hypothetical protein